MVSKFSVCVAVVVAASACGDATPEQQTAGATEVALGTLRFTGDGGERLDGVLLEGKPIRVAYDPARLSDCEGYQGGNPVWSITGFYQLGEGERKSFPVLDPNHPEGYEHVLVPAEAGEMQLWFQSTNKWGCLAWDSDRGANYRFDVKASTELPTWAGDERMELSVCEEEGPCVVETLPLTQELVWGTTARHRAPNHHIYFEAWEPTVTDWDNPDVAHVLEARIHARYDASSPYESWPVDPVGREGDNALWMVNIRHLDPFGGVPVHLEEKCPTVPFYDTEDGTRVAADLHYYFSINGVEIRPEGGSYQARFEDYAGLYDLCRD